MIEVIVYTTSTSKLLFSKLQWMASLVMIPFIHQLLNEKGPRKSSLDI